jgi:outer membrane protein OmpU
MRKLLYATTALTTAALIAGTAGDAAAQTPPSPSPYREQLPTPPTTTVPATPAPAPYVSKSAERIKLGLSGYFQEWGVITDQNLKSRVSATGAPLLGGTLKSQPTNLVSQKHNSEVCVIGQTTLDNGLTIGVNIQLEANSEADTLDESYLFLQSPTLGQIIVGDENNAGYLLHVTAPDGGISLDSGDLCNIRAFELGLGVSPGGGAAFFDSPLCTTNLRLLDNDSGKFTYITPRFAGFQAGVSYIPEFQNGGDNNSAIRRAGIFDVNSTDSGQTRGIGNGWAGGLNFTETLGGVGVQASGGILWAETGLKAPTATATTADFFTSNKDLLAYNAGAQFSFAGFSVGGGWLYVPQGPRPTTVSGTTVTNDRMNGMSWTVGGAYEFGPYKVGIDYMTGTNNKTAGGGKDRLDQGIVSGTYTLGPGIRLVGGVMYYDWQEENRNSENQNGWGGLTGLKLAF